MLRKVVKTLSFVLAVLVLMLALLVSTTQGGNAQEIPNKAIDKPAPTYADRSYRWHE